MSMSNFSFPMGIRDSASSPASTTLASSTNHQTTRGLSNAVDSLGLRSPKNKHKRTTTSISYSGLTPLADATGALNPSAHPTRPATFMRHMRRVSSSFPRSSGMKRSSESDDARTEPSSVKSPRLPIPFQFMSPKEETDFVPMSSAEFHVGVTPANSLANIEDAATKFGYSSLPVSASFTIITSPSLDMKLAAAEAHSITINPQENAYNPKSSQDNAFPTLPSLSSLEKALNEAALSLQTISALTLPDLPSTTKPGIDDMASATSQTKPTNAFEAEVKTPSSASRQVHFGSIEYLFFKASDAVNVQHRGATHHEEVASPPLSPQFPLRTFHHNGNISFLEEFPDNIRQLLAESPSVNVNEEVQTQTPGMTTSDSVDTISSEGSFTSIDLSVIETEEATIMNAQVIPQATASPTLSDLSPGMSWLSAFYQGPSALRPIPSPTLDNPVPSPLQLSFPADIQDEKNEKSESMCREEVPPALSSADSARVMTPSSVLSASASGTMLDINSSLDKKAADQTNEREKQETSTTTQGEDSTNGIIGSMMKRASWLNIFMSRSS